MTQESEYKSALLAKYVRMCKELCSGIVTAVLYLTE